MASTQGMILDGAFATEALDTSFESISIAGIDTSSIDAGEGTANSEHKGPKDDQPALHTVGKILMVKKIFTEDDCQDDRQRMFFQKVGRLPYLYGKVRLYDAAGHPEAVAIAAQVRDHVANNEPILVRFSIEGSTTQQDGHRLLATIARRVAMTIQPANKTAVSGLVSDPQAPPGFQKSEPVFEDPEFGHLGHFDNSIEVSELYKSEDDVEEELDKSVLDPKAGYSFQDRSGYRLRDGYDHIVEAVHSGKVVGHVKLRLGRKGGNMHSLDTQVESEHRRKGVASAMYDYAERKLERTMTPSGDKTDDGKALWRGNKGLGSSRQFGPAKYAKSEAASEDLASVLERYEGPWERDKVKEFVKANLPQVDDSFVDKFLDLTDELHLKKAEPRSPHGPIESEPGYAYHATNEWNAHDIAQSGLDVHRPDYGTEQDVWPDGATEKRSYHSDNASAVGSFAPVEGEPIILRTRTDSHPFQRESTGDLYSKKKIPAHKIEIGLDDGSWVPLQHWSSSIAKSELDLPELGEVYRSLEATTIELRKAVNYVVHGPRQELPDVRRIDMVVNGKRHPAGRIMLVDGHVHHLEDYHGLASAVHPEGPHDGTLKLGAPEPFQAADDQGQMRQVAQEAVQPPPRPPVFDYHRAGMDRPHKLEFTDQGAAIDGKKLDDRELALVHRNVNSGAATLRYAAQEKPLNKAEYGGGSDDPDSALQAVRSAVAAGHIHPDVERALTKHIFEDPMVGGVGNKYAYKRFLEKDRPGAHVGIDMNSLKHVNNKYGHEVGDDAIKSTFGAFREAAAEVGTGKLFRNGGDEGVAHFPTHEDATNFLRIARDKFEKLPPVKGVHRLSFSAGIGTNPAEADKALYQAKLGKFHPGQEHVPYESRKLKFKPGTEPNLIHSLTPGAEGAMDSTPASQAKLPSAA